MELTVTKRHSSTPVYRRIQDAIRAQIESVPLRPGDVISSERELARAYKVSLMTARHALTGLEREGVVERRRGAGTFVAAPKIHFNQLMSYMERMSSRGLDLQSRVLLAKVVESIADVAVRLGTTPGSPLVKIELLRYTSDEPLALETSYLSAKLFSKLVTATLGRTPLYAILEKDYGIRIAYADEEIDATTADATISKVLQTSPTAPLLRVRQVTYSTAGEATVYTIGFYRSERETLSIRRFR